MSNNPSIDSLLSSEGTVPAYEMLGEDPDSILIEEVSDLPQPEEEPEKPDPKPSMPNNHDPPSSEVAQYKPAGEIEKIEKDADADDDDEDFEDETFGERLIGLTEMFPEAIRNLTYSLGVGSLNFGKGFYNFSRSAVWIIATSAIILAAPTLIESEKSQLEEMNRQQQRQILLGPSASGASSLTPTLTPPQPIK